MRRISSYHKSTSIAQHIEEVTVTRFNITLLNSITHRLSKSRRQSEGGEETRGEEES